LIGAYFLSTVKLVPITSNVCEPDSDAADAAAAAAAAAAADVVAEEAAMAERVVRRRGYALPEWVGKSFPPHSASAAN